MSPTEPETYTIEQAGETLGVSAADIRSYIEEGLVVPREGPGGAAVFTRVQMRRLWSIVTLHRDLGINLPGVAAVLQLREQFEQVRRDLVTLVEIVERELGPDVWDRLWPEGRPRPDAHISVEGFSDLSPPSVPEDSANGDNAVGGDPPSPGGTCT
jgi:MerR family transcriptional regulator/heat shock protein HspR